MEQFVGEIRMFGGNYAPLGWAFCNGQLLSIAENDVLFALIGTTYGGDGQTTFALPDLRGRVPIHMGQNPATGTTFNQGQAGGSETVTLTVAQLAAHTHPVQAVTTEGNQSSPANGLWAATVLNPFSEQNPATAMAPNAVSPSGGGQPHDNVMPFQCINFIIATEGMWPSQN